MTAIIITIEVIILLIGYMFGYMHGNRKALGDAIGTIEYLENQHREIENDVKRMVQEDKI